MALDINPIRRVILVSWAFLEAILGWFLSKGEDKVTGKPEAEQLRKAGTIFDREEIRAKKYNFMTGKAAVLLGVACGSGIVAAVVMSLLGAGIDECVGMMCLIIVSTYFLARRSAGE